jgi:AraC-like DNA-binding protein
VTYGHTLADGKTIRPAEIAWHMVFVKTESQQFSFLVGPWESSGMVSYGAGAEILWLRFKLGSFLPHLPTRKILNSEIMLPDAVRNAFWLNSTAWERPTFDNVETFISRLAREELLVLDPLVRARLEAPMPHVSERTLRHRFLQSTGLSQGHIEQFERAKTAAELLAQGHSIQDTVFSADYFDQAHMTKALKRFIGYTPAQLLKRGG